MGALCTPATVGQSLLHHYCCTSHLSLSNCPAGWDWSTLLHVSQSLPPSSAQPAAYSTAFPGIVEALWRRARSSTLIDGATRHQHLCLEDTVFTWRLKKKGMDASMHQEAVGQWQRTHPSSAINPFSGGGVERLRRLLAHAVAVVAAEAH